MSNPSEGFRRRVLRGVLRTALQIYPSYMGIMRLMEAKLTRAFAPQRIVKTRLRSGEWIMVDPRDYCGRPIYWWGDYDPRVTRLCLAPLRAGDTFLDIGANYGEIALAAARRVGETGTVHAFEPNSATAKLLRRSAGMNGFLNLHVHEVALGREDCEGWLEFPQDGNCGAARVRERGWTEGGDHRIRVRHAGRFLGRLGLSRLRVLKIDVEGMEEDVLVPSRHILERHQPELVVFESHDNHVPFLERPVPRLLLELQYSLHQLVLDARQFRPSPRLREIRDSRDMGHGYDFAAVKKHCSG